MKVLVVLRRVGPYHHARFQEAVSSGLDLVVLETRSESNEYAWDFEIRPSYKVVTLPKSLNIEIDIPNAQLDQSFDLILVKEKPIAVVSVGWSDRSYLRLINSCFVKKIPMIIISDSRFIDKSRSFFNEFIKRQLLRNFQSALVAGRQSRAYLKRLGIKEDVIFQPWDVVDNSYFYEKKLNSNKTMEPHFLCVSRFLERKNHETILKAYADYQNNGGSWNLRFIGSGPLEKQIHSLALNLPNPSRFYLDSFQQQEELANSYCNASAFILSSTQDTWGLVINEAIASQLPCIVSTSCGCSCDLIENEKSGFTFNPKDFKALSILMKRIEEQSLLDRQMIIDLANERLLEFTLESFANGLKQAVEASLVNPRFSKRGVFVARLLSKCL